MTKLEQQLLGVISLVVLFLDQYSSGQNWQVRQEIDNMKEQIEKILKEYVLEKDDGK